MLSNFGTPRMRRIAYIVLAVLVPAVLLIAIFNFIQYEQHAATKNIPVAVVNKDQPAESNGQLIDVGQQVVNTLKKDHQVKWEFVSEKTAKKQLADGDAYLEIELPKNFSENATTLMAKDPKVSLIKLHESKRNNFLSSMVTTTVADTVQSQVKTKVQKVYSQTLLSSLKKLGNGTKQAASGTQQLDDGMTQLKDGQTEITRNLDLLSTKMVTFESGAKTLKDGVDTYTTGVDTLTAADKQLAAGLHTLQESAEPLVSGTAQLATGSKTLSSGVKQYTDGVSQLTSGNQQINAGLSQLNSKTGALKSGTDQLATGSNSLALGLHQLRYGVEGSSDPDKAGIDSGLEQIQAGISANDSIIASVSDMTKQMKQAQTDTAAVKSDLSDLSSGLDTLNSLVPVLKQVQSMKSQLGLLNFIPNATAVKAKQSDANTKAQAVLDAVNALPNDTPNKSDLVSKAEASVKSTSSLGTTAVMEANALQTVKTTANSAFSSVTLSSTEAQAMIDKLESLQTESNKLLDETSPLLSDTTINELNSVASSTQTLKTGLSHFQSVVDSNLDQLSTGATQLADGNQQLSDQAPALVSGVQQLLDGSNQVVAGGNQLNANTSALVSGAAQLATGNATLAASAPALISGVAQLVSGGDQIVSGGNQLTSASSQLRSGTSQIYDATVTAKSGADQLASGSHQLLDGTDTAADGVSTLNKALQDGADQIGTIHAGSSNVNHLATPISNKEEGATSESLKNTFAPLMLALVLFLGAVVTQLGLFTPERRKRHTLFEEPLLAIGLTAVAQAVIADVLLAVLGVSVASWFGLTFFSLIVSVLFTAICMTLYHMFGRVGVLFAVLLALLQIIITGQVFPNAMLSSFYQGIASILPMTHAIHGFDALINGTNYNVLLAIVFLLLFTVVLAGIAYLIDFLVAKRLTDNEEPEEK